MGQGSGQVTGRSSREHGFSRVEGGGVDTVRVALQPLQQRACHMRKALRQVDAIRGRRSGGRQRGRRSGGRHTGRVRGLRRSRCSLRQRSYVRRGEQRDVCAGRADARSPVPTGPEMSNMCARESVLPVATSSEACSDEPPFLPHSCGEQKARSAPRPARNPPQCGPLQASTLAARLAAGLGCMRAPPPAPRPPHRCCRAAQGPRRRPNRRVVAARPSHSIARHGMAWHGTAWHCMTAQDGEPSPASVAAAVARPALFRRTVQSAPVTTS